MADGAALTRVRAADLTPGDTWMDKSLPRQMGTRVLHPVKPVTRRDGSPGVSVVFSNHKEFYLPPDRPCVVEKTPVPMRKTFGGEWVPRDDEEAGRG